MDLFSLASCEQIPHSNMIVYHEWNFIRFVIISFVKYLLNDFGAMVYPMAESYKYIIKLQHYFWKITGIIDYAAFIAHQWPMLCRVKCYTMYEYLV